MHTCIQKEKKHNVKEKRKKTFVNRIELKEWAMPEKVKYLKSRI